MSHGGPIRRRGATGRQSRARLGAKAQPGLLGPETLRPGSPGTASLAKASGGYLQPGTPLFEQITDLLAEMLARDLELRPPQASDRVMPGCRHVRTEQPAHAE